MYEFNSSIKGDSNKNDDAYRDGAVQVSNGLITVSDPSGGGKPARVTPGKGVKLFINNMEIKEPTHVFHDSIIRVEIDNLIPVRKLNINLQDNNLSAIASTIYEEGLNYSLNDKPNSNSIVLDVKPVGKAACPPYTIDEVKDVLKEKGIISGIDGNKLSELINDGKGNPIIVARGVSPVDETDDAIKKLYDDADKEFIEVNGRVDYYSIGKITSVSPGQLIVEKIKGREGAAGTDVFGHPIPYKKGKKVTLLLGRGVRISDDGLKVYSEIFGRPEIKDGLVSVYEVFEIATDVDVATGNIDFVGDVIVKRNINEGMKVKSGGNVVVFGGITGGEVESAGDVTINKNVIGGRIKGGCGDLVKYNIIDVMAKIKEYIKAILSAATKLRDSGKVADKYKDGQIIKLLIDTKFGRMSGYITDLRKLLSQNKSYVDKDVMQVGALLIKYFSGNGPLLIENLNELNVLMYRLDERISVLKRMLKQPSNITISYAQNSVLSTSGNIKVTGKGCYNSELSCLGDVAFERPGSVLRGGMVDAQGSVKVYELGSPGGAMTTVGAGKESQITCEIAHMNSVIKVGEMSMKIGEPVKKLKAYIDKGELMVEKSRI